MEDGAVGHLGPVVEVTVEDQSPDLATSQLQPMEELTVWGQVIISTHVLGMVAKVRLQNLYITSYFIIEYFRQ